MDEFKDVDTPGIAYLEMAEQGRWDLLGALQSTILMQAGRREWLPTHEAEGDQSYAARLKRNKLYAFFDKTVDRLSSKPFSKPVGTVDEDKLDPRLLALLDDMDGEGTDLTGFAKEQSRLGVKYGLSHALVDFSTLEGNLPNEQSNEDGSPPTRLLTRGEEEALGARVAVTHITPPNLIDWEFRRERGRVIVGSIRFRGSRTERDDSGFGQREIRTVTHYKSDSVDIYTKDGQQDWILASSKLNTFGRVPLVTWYTGRMSNMVARPPMLNLAETNLSHWQVNADFLSLANIVSISRFFTRGFAKDEVRASSVIGPSKAIHAKSKDADAKWVEHSGKGLESLEKLLQKIEDRAAQQASQPTSRDRSAITATGEIRDASDSICDLQSWVGAQDRALQQIMELAAEWYGVEVPDSFQFNIYRGFTIGQESAEEMKLIQRDAEAGRITTKLYLEEGKRRGIYPEHLDAEDEINQANIERAQRAVDQIPDSDGSIIDEEVQA